MSWYKKLLITLVFLPLIFLLYTNIIVQKSVSNHFVWLAESFTQGHTYFLHPPVHKNDLVLYEHKYYWPLGPFPAILYMPIVYSAQVFDFNATTGYLNFVVILVTIYFLYQLIRKFNYAKFDSYILTAAIVFGSTYVTTAISSQSYYFSHTLVTCLMIISFYEFFTKRRWWLIGLLVGMVVATRMTAGLYGLFFLYNVLKIKNWNIKNIGYFLFPIAVSGVLLAIYNYVRFDSIFDQGYSTQLLLQEKLRVARDVYGLLSLHHVPGNIYHAFFAVPGVLFADHVSHVLRFPYIRVDGWGTGIFFTSPYLLTLFFIQYKDKYVKPLLSTACIIALPIMMYYGIGFYQVSYRYALDFLPLLFLIFIIGYRQRCGLKQYEFVLSKRMIAVCIYSICITSYLCFISHLI